MTVATPNPLPSVILNDVLALASAIRCRRTRAGRQEVARTILRQVGDARTYLDVYGTHHPEIGRPTLENVANRYRCQFPGLKGGFEASNPDHRDSLRMALDALDEADGVRVNRTEAEVAA